MTDKPAFNPSAWNVKPKTAPADPRVIFDPQAALEAKRKAKLAKLNVLDAPLGLVPTTSFSSLSNFEKCPHHLFLSKVEKCPDVAGPAADRGTKIHDKAEQFIKGESGDELPKELMKFEDLFQDLRTRYSDGLIHVEEDWAFTRGRGHLTSCVATYYRHASPLAPNLV